MSKSGTSKSWTRQADDYPSGWDEPAFPNAQPDDPRPTLLLETPQGHAVAAPAAHRYRTSGAVIAFACLAAGLGWIAFLVMRYIASDGVGYQGDIVATTALACSPLILLAVIALVALFLLRETPAAEVLPLFTPGTERLTHSALASAERLSDAHVQMQEQSEALVALAEAATGAMLGSVQGLTAENSRIGESLDNSSRTLAALTEQLSTLGDVAPRIEDRIATLAETLESAGRNLANQSRSLEEQISAAALVAEEVRAQLDTSNDDVRRQMIGLRSDAQATGEELAGLSEIASARIDLTLERVNTVLSLAGQKIEAQNNALDELVNRSTQAIDGAADHSFERFSTHCDEIAARLDSLGTRLDSQSEKSRNWLDGLTQSIAVLSAQFDALESAALDRTQRLNSAVTALSGETQRLGEALDASDTSSAQLIARVEALILTLDSSIRELDESVPAAIGRAEQHMATLTGRIADAGPAIEAMGAVAGNVAHRLGESDQIARAHVQRLTHVLQRSQGVLNAQKQQIGDLAQAIEAANGQIGLLGESVGPQMIAALEQVRVAADAAAARAREAITAAVPDAAQALGAASAQAMEAAMARSVTEQLDRVALVADNAVKAAHRSTDKLNRQMLALTDSSTALEQRLAAAGAMVEEQDQELLSRRSSDLIDALNSRALDVSKWLDTDVGQLDWGNYLKGDQNFFTRRAVRLLSGGEAKDIGRLYAQDADFAEHVNRYIADFETLLRGVLKTRHGSALAVTMLSSDIGKLYVALAQGIDRLPPR